MQTVRCSTVQTDTGHRQRDKTIVEVLWSLFFVCCVRSICFSCGNRNLLLYCILRKYFVGCIIGLLMLPSRVGRVRHIYRYITRSIISAVIYYGMRPLQAKIILSVQVCFTSHILRMHSPKKGMTCILVNVLYVSTLQQILQQA